jgi:hypothetical protein
VIGGSAVLVVVAGELGLYGSARPGQTPQAASAPAPAATVPVAGSATPAPVAIASVPTRVAAENWMVVQHTNGLGLVLRPTPASEARVLLLQEGARLHVTGSAVQQAGRAWLPVTSSNGTSGWVASEFLVPEP